MTDLSWPEPAHFAWQSIVGPFAPSPRTMADHDRAYFGLVPEASFLYGKFVDSENEIFEPTRRIPANERVRGMAGLVHQSTLNDDDYLHINVEVSLGAATSYGHRRRVDNSPDGGELATWKSAPWVSGNPWSVTMTPTTCTWHEEGVLHIEGTLLAPGLQWYIPGPDKGFYYMSQLYEATGTIEGREVRGFFGFDRDYMPEGGMLYISKDILVEEHLHNAWYTWATKYTDGTYDAGHFLLTNDRGSFAIFTNDEQEVTRTNNLTGTVTTRDDGVWPAGIKFDVDGEAWEFTPDPRGIMPDFMTADKALPTAQNEGTIKRVGETREPVLTMAWGEIVPSHGTAQTMRWRG